MISFAHGPPGLIATPSAPVATPVATTPVQDPSERSDSAPSVCVIRVSEEETEAAGQGRQSVRKVIGPQSCSLTPSEVHESSEGCASIGVYFPPVVAAGHASLAMQHTEPAVAKVVENSYTPDIESLLESLTGPLEVVHQVSPQDVRRHLENWKQAAQDELNSLEGMQAIRRHRGAATRHILNDPGVEILPAKCVFTVKPGKPYRRKVRIVSCGNYAQGVSEDVLYASGAAAETLRAVLVRSGQRRYAAWSTDIKTHSFSPLYRVPQLSDTLFDHLRSWFYLEL